MLKGIEPSQQTLAIPSGELAADGNEIGAILGSRMAVNLNANEGDLLLVRWRDSNGMFDAVEVKVRKIFHADVPAIDLGQLECVGVPTVEIERRLRADIAVNID